MTGSNSSECEWGGVLKLRVQDPDAMLAWIIENIPEGTVHGINATQVGRDDGYDVEILIDDTDRATLIKTFWDGGK
jgi:hypothetical protein